MKVTVRLGLHHSSSTSSSFKELLSIAVACQALLGLAFLASAASLAGNPFAGEVGCVTGIVYVGFAGVA
jgi:hypothetical protein